jgi:hypothetical protein
MQVEIRYCYGESTRMDPNYHRVVIFDLPVQQKLPSKNDKVR